jgi:hypothetical protein
MRSAPSKSITITPQTPGWEDSDLWRERMYIDGKEVRFVSEREMIRDYDKELDHCDGFSYWRTTGRLIVTWYNGNKTIIANKDVAINAKVIDCGYDDALPF